MKIYSVNWHWKDIANFIMNIFAPTISAQLAQLVEQKTMNLEVLSLNPVDCVILFYFIFFACLFWLKHGLRPANVLAALRAGLRPSWTRFARCARPAAAKCYFGISAILTGYDAFNRLNIIIFVISRSILVEFDTSLALFRKFYFWRPFWFFF